MAIKRVLTYLGALFLMSHIIVSNVAAVNINQNVNFVKGYFYPYWSDNHNRTYAIGGYQYSSNGDYANSTIQYFRTGSNSALTASSGQYVSLTGSIVISVTSQSQAVSIQANPRQYFSISSNNTDCPLIDLDYDEQQYQTQGTTWLLRYSFSSVCRLKSNVTNNVAMNFNLNGNSTSGTDYLNFIPQYIGVWEADEGVDLSGVISAINTANNRLNSIINLLNNNNSTLSDILDALGEIHDNQHDVNQEQADATNEAVSDSQDAGDSSTSDAQTGTASLISTIGSAVSAISSASPTNCLLDGDMGNFDMGQIDLCANPVPAFVQIIGSLILILVTVPLCIVLFNRFIGLFRSFQG